MAILSGYTMPLAAAAGLIIRLGKVWEDARSILLVVVLLFLALSVSFDESGLAFAVFLSEGLFWLLGIRLAPLIRTGFYLILSLFFIYPVGPNFLLHRGSTEALLWGIFAFPSAMALCFLWLVLAIRRGASYVRNNGTPWKWPWFPWVLFGVLAFGVSVRSYYLCISFVSGGRGDTMFGPYFLVPFLLVLCFLAWKSAS